MQASAPLRLVAHDVEGREGRARGGRRQRRGEHEAPVARAQVVAEVAVAGDVAALGAERLGEGPHHHRHPPRQAEVLERPGAVGAEHPGGVGLVDHQHAAVALGDLDDGRQGREVAVHEKTVSVTIRRRRPRRAAHRRLQGVGVGVRVAHHLGPRQPAAVDEAGVVELVREHHVPASRPAPGSCRRWPGSRSGTPARPRSASARRSAPPGARCRSRLPVTRREAPAPAP